MKKILFLTYYYPPCNATGANRPASFVSNFITYGYHVTVVTRHWTGNEKNWNDQIGSDDTLKHIVKNELSEIHYLPYKRYEYNKVSGTLDTGFQNMMGNFNYELQFNQYRTYVQSLFDNHRFDYILVSSPPLTVVKEGYFFSRKYGLPLIIDIRDFENDITLFKKVHITLSRKLQHLILMRYFKKWTSGSVIVTASPPLTNYIKKNTRVKEAVTLNNGFNLPLLQINEVQSIDAFNITLTGSLNNWANLDFMETCFCKLFEQFPDINIRFNFIGLQMDPAIAEKFRRVIPSKNLLITERVPQHQAHKIASGSHVLLLAGFDKLKGAYTTKVFEYLGLRRNILQLPGDNDVVEELLNETGAGKAPKTVEEAIEIIVAWYQEWKVKGGLAYYGDMNEILKWSREEQFKKLLKLLE